MTSKQRVLAAVRGEPRDRVPVTPLFMSWAAKFIGRTFRDYYLHGDVLAEAQLAVARAMGTDHVTCMGEPWAEADSYGMRLDYPQDGVGIPRANFLRSPGDVKKLRLLDPHAMPRMKQRLICLATLAREAGETHVVVGWVEGPIAEYADLRGLQDAMLDLVDQPETFHAACEVLVPSAIRFAEAQVAAGASMVGVGDAAASLIGPQLYTEHVLPWVKKLIGAIKRTGVVVKLHVCGNARAILPAMATSGADVIDVDWMVPLREARQQVGADVALAGNFDPSAVLLSGSPQAVADASRRCIAEAGDRFILQPGCEVPPETPIENLRAFCPTDGCLIVDALRRDPATHHASASTAG